MSAPEAETPRGALPLVVGNRPIRHTARLGRSLRRTRSAVAGIIAQLGRPTKVGAYGALRPQVVRFAVIGVFSTLAYSLLYLLLRGPLGPFWANVVALVATACANTAANRRITFRIRGRTDALRHQIQGLAILAVGLAVTSGSLWLLHATESTAGRFTETVVLTAANLFVTVMRFVVMRLWVFTRR